MKWGIFKQKVPANRVLGEEERAIIEEKRASGLTIPEIAKDLDLSVSCVAKYTKVLDKKNSEDDLQIKRREYEKEKIENDIQALKQMRELRQAEHEANLAELMSEDDSDTWQSALLPLIAPMLQNINTNRQQPKPVPVVLQGAESKDIDIKPIESELLTKEQMDLIIKQVPKKVLIGVKKGLITKEQVISFGVQQGYTLKQGVQIYQYFMEVKEND